LFNHNTRKVNKEKRKNVENRPFFTIEEGSQKGGLFRCWHNNSTRIINKY
jgi:hypothetical protein